MRQFLQNYCLLDILDFQKVEINGVKVLEFSLVNASFSECAQKAKKEQTKVTIKVISKLFNIQFRKNLFLRYKGKKGGGVGCM